MPGLRNPPAQPGLDLRQLRAADERGHRAQLCAVCGCGPCPLRPCCTPVAGMSWSRPGIWRSGTDTVLACTRMPSTRMPSVHSIIHIRAYIYSVVGELRVPAARTRRLHQAWPLCVLMNFQQPVARMHRGPHGSPVQAPALRSRRNPERSAGHRQCTRPHGDSLWGLGGTP